MTKRWKQRPPGSNWGDFGPDDQRGRMNWVTREKVLQGIAEVKEGIAFCCSLPLDYPGGAVLNPRRSPPRLAQPGGAVLTPAPSPPPLAAPAPDGRQVFCPPVYKFKKNMTDVICDDQ